MPPPPFIFLVRFKRVLILMREINQTEHREGKAINGY